MRSFWCIKTWERFKCFIIGREAKSTAPPPPADLDVAARTDPETCDDVRGDFVRANKIE